MFKTVKTSLKNDLIAGFCVFLLALPLCLGIASLSNFPPIAGIMTAIVGGMVCALFGGAELAIKGPAAGLVVIVLGAVNQLGAGDSFLGYKRTLAVGVVAGFIQVVIGQLRKAVIAEIIPTFVIHGLLTAIGIIIVSKQSYTLLGITPQSSNPLELLSQLPFHVMEANLPITLIGLLSFAMVLILPKIRQLSAIPSSMVVLLCVIPFSIYFDLNSRESLNLFDKTYVLSPSFFINLPAELWTAIQLPDFSVIFSPLSLKYILLLAVIGSIESVLTVCAIDSLGTQRKPSNLNRDLSVLGIGNIVSSFIGGMPMISEIVRSKANMDYGAVSVKANFFHGMFMLIAALLLPSVMNFIPLAALAALLIAVGIKLASPKEFIHAYKVGKDQFSIFLLTCFITLTVDLLAGVLVGIGLQFLMHVIREKHIKGLFSPIITTEMLPNGLQIRVEGSLTFISYLKLKKKVSQAVNQSKAITIDLSMTTFLDHTVINKLKNINREFHDVSITISDNQELIPFYNHPLSARKVPNQVAG